MQSALLKYRILPTARIGIDEVRAYVARTFGWEPWLHTSAHLQETIAYIRQFPESGHVPAELEAFADGRYRQVNYGKSRIVYQVLDGTLYLHLVADSRRDLQGLLQRIALRLM